MVDNPLDEEGHDEPDGPLRPNVSVIVLNSNGYIFLGERSDEPGHWQFPQGGLESSETLEENAFRELSEETGIDRSSCEPLGVLAFTHEYRWPASKREKIPHLSQWVGQSQRFFVILFRGDDAEVALDKDTQIEFAAWRWCPRDQVLSEVSPVRQAGYAGALAELEERLPQFRPFRDVS